MKHFKTTCCLFLAYYILVGLNHLPAQTLTPQDKYWEYRKRFVEQMAVMGKSPGYSIPFSEVHPTQINGFLSIMDGNCGDSSLAVLSCSDPDDGNFVIPGAEPASVIDPPETFSWAVTPGDPFNSTVHPGGDGTIRLGYYIALLATELHLLIRNGQPLEATAEELDYALEAFNRLDSLAETFYDLPGKVDGFFVRTDVPQHIYWKFRENKLRWKDIDYDGLTYTIEASNYNHCRSTEADINNGQVMSQDQCIHMLFGTALVKRLVPDCIIGSGGISLKRKAQQIAHNIVTYLDRMEWIIRDPDGTRASHRWGGDALAFKHGFKKAAVFICGNDIDPNASYHNGTLPPIIPTTATAKLWNKAYDGFQLLNTHSQTMFLSLITTSNAGPVFVNPVHSALFSMRTHVTGLGEEIQSFIYPLAYMILHNEVYPTSNSDYFLFPASAPIPVSYTPANNNTFLSLLSTAPDAGICATLGSGCPGTLAGFPCGNNTGWTSPNRWENPQKDLFYPAIGNGMDYMLLYNLYHLYYELSSPYANPYGDFSHAFDYTFFDQKNYPKINPSRSYVDGISPFQTKIKKFSARNSVFSKTNPGQVSNKTIVSIAKLHANGDRNRLENADVSYKASEQIKLRPGFQAHSASQFTGQIVPYQNPISFHESVSVGGSDTICVGIPSSLFIQGDCYFPNDVSWELLGEPGISLSRTTGNSIILTGSQPGVYTIKVTATSYSGQTITRYIYIHVLSFEDCILYPKKEGSLLPVTACWSPNPTNGKLILNLENLTDPGQLLIQIRDLSGKLVKEELIKVLHKGNAQYVINISDQSAGIYLARISGSGISQTDKIVKR